MKAPRKYTPRHATSIAGSRTFNGRRDVDNMYDRVWEAYRSRFLSVNRFCYSCGHTSTVVDHLRPHKGDVNLFRKTDNHIPLCKRCHDTVTSMFDRNFKIGNSIDPKIQWLQNVRAMNMQSFKVIVLGSYEG